MKPLLIFPPAPQRWPATEALLADQPAPLRADLQARLAGGVEGARDAVAIVPDGAHALACGVIRRRGAVGVLGPLTTRPEHRRRGHALRLMQTLLSWFDMSGGRWLYLTAPRPLLAGFLENFGFRPLHNGAAEGDSLLLVRALGGVSGEPLARPDAAIDHVGPLDRATFPLVAALLAARGAPDPRTSPGEAAATAEATALELIDQAQRGTFALLGAWHRDHLAALGTLAIDQLGQRTYAMTIPARSGAAALREALLTLGREKGYAQVDFPMEMLGGAAS